MRLFRNKTSHNQEKPCVRWKLPERVYYVESPEDDTVLVAIDVEIKEYHEDNTMTVSWYDTTHERSMAAKEIIKKDSYFQFERIMKDGERHYRFIPMSLEIYNKKIKDRLVAGSDFSNKEELIEAFLNTLKNEV